VLRAQLVLRNLQHLDVPARVDRKMVQPSPLLADSILTAG
jgi:hypothetical protein